MSEVLPDPHRTAEGTRERILDLIISEGPISAAELGRRLALTPAAIRRHLTGFTDSGLVQSHDSQRAPGRGRPARRYVATESAQSALSAGYSHLAVELLDYLGDAGGAGAVETFVNKWAQKRAARYAPAVTGETVTERATELAQALAGDGFAASVRPVAGLPMVQLCQGHCPVQEVAARFPQLCEAETAAFSELIGSHVQRLATLARGAHACTTNIPVRNV